MSFQLFSIFRTSAETVIIIIIIKYRTRHIISQFPLQLQLLDPVSFKKLGIPEIQRCLPDKKSNKSRRTNPQDYSLRSTRSPNPKRTCATTFVITANPTDNRIFGLISPDKPISSDRRDLSASGQLIGLAFVGKKRSRIRSVAAVGWTRSSYSFSAASKYGSQ